tara:strand:- start:3495 stop:4439 length:945 start_codon:yes stop_codon:yes gene_type:complete
MAINFRFLLLLLIILNYSCSDSSEATQEESIPDPEENISKPCNTSNLILDVDFNSYISSELYTLAMANTDFGSISARTSGEIRGLDSNEKIWPHKTRVENGVLKAEYLKGVASGRFGGFLFDRTFPDSEEAVMEYKVKFDKDLIWAYGGKLPGLGGSSLTNNGSIPSGGTKNLEYITNGFSARLMWRQSGEGKPVRLVVYTYFPDRDIEKSGVEIEFIRDIQLDTWYTIKQYIKLNTPGERDGLLKMYVNGELKLDRNDILYRNTGKSNVKINAAILNTYRGGAADDTRWHSTTTDYIYFDDFKVWNGCYLGSV